MSSIKDFVLKIRCFKGRRWVFECFQKSDTVFEKSSLNFRRTNLRHGPKWSKTEFLAFFSISRFLTIFIFFDFDDFYKKAVFTDKSENLKMRFFTKWIFYFRFFCVLGCLCCVFLQKVFWCDTKYIKKAVFTQGFASH